MYILGTVRLNSNEEAAAIAGDTQPFRCPTTYSNLIHPNITP